MSKRTYNVYRLGINFTGRELRHYAMPVGMKKLPVDARWEMLFDSLTRLWNQAVYADDQPMLHQLVSVACQLDAEYRWWKARCHTYFVEDAALLHKAYLMGRDIRMDEFRMPHQVVCFSPPTGVTIEGVELQPFLFSCFKVLPGRDYHTHERSMLQGFGDRAAHEDAPVRRASVVMRGRDFSEMTITAAQEADWQRIFAAQSEPPQGHTYSFGNIPIFEPLQQDEHRLLCTHARIGTGLLLYMMAYPDAVSEGLPRDSVVDAAVVNNRNVRPHRLVTVPALRGPISPHWRSAHFRVLRDPKYYKGESVPPDRYRVVFVHSAMVHRDQVDAKTVHDTPEEDIPCTTSKS